MDQNTQKKETRLESDKERPRYRTLQANALDYEEQDKVQYRSMTLVSPPLGQSFGMNVGGHLMHVRPYEIPTFTHQNTKNESSMPIDSTETSYGPRVDSNNYSNVKPKELPPSPFQLEMHTHFHIKNTYSIQRICTVIGKKMCDLDTDFIFKAEKCKWKVLLRQNMAGIKSPQRMSLNIVLYQCPKKEYTLEVQRRDGDITAFMQFYHEMKQFFYRNQLLTEKIKSIIGVKRPAPVSAIAVSSNEMDRWQQDAVKHIHELLDSKYQDVQLQGLLAAISFSAKVETRLRMATLVPTLVTLSQTQNKSIKSLVGVVLSRVCDHPACQEAFIQSKGWQNILKYAIGGKQVSKELQRESLRVIECLCPIYHDKLVEIDGASKVFELLKQWESIDDPRLKKRAHNAHRALENAGILA